MLCNIMLIFFCHFLEVQGNWRHWLSTKSANCIHHTFTHQYIIINIAGGKLYKEINHIMLKMIFEASGCEQRVQQVGVVSGQWIYLIIS